MFLLATLLALMLVRMLFPIFPAVPVGIHKHVHQDGKRQHGKDDHHWPILPGLAQELEAVMDHDGDTIHGVAANPNREFVNFRRGLRLESVSPRWFLVVASGNDAAATQGVNRQRMRAQRIGCGSLGDGDSGF